jgi:hypothetical protein
MAGNINGMRPKLLALVALLLMATAAPGAPPKVVKAAPDNGQLDVDPATRELRIEFDQPMNTGGAWSVVGGGASFPHFFSRPRWV